MRIIIEVTILTNVKDLKPLIIVQHFHRKCIYIVQRPTIETRPHRCILPRIHTPRSNPNDFRNRLNGCSSYSYIYNHTITSSHHHESKKNTITITRLYTHDKQQISPLISAIDGLQRAAAIPARTRMCV